MNIEIKQRIEQIENGEVPEGYEKTKAGVIPNSWEVNCLRDITKKVLDGTHATPRYKSNGIKFFSVENVTNDNFGDTKYISQEEHERLSKRCPVEKGDILMTRIGSIGDTKLIDWNVTASIYVSLALIKPNNIVDSKYIYMYTKCNNFLKEARSRSLLNATPQKINLSEISKLRIIGPKNKPEQNKIATVLSTWDKAIAQQGKLIGQKKEQKRGLMQRLLSGKLRLPGFDGEWEEVRLGDVAKKRNVKNSDNDINNVFTNSAVNGIVIQTDFFDKKIANNKNLNTYYIVRNNDFVYNPRISATASCGPINRNKTNTDGLVSPLYTIFAIDDSCCNLDFMEQYFQSTCWHKYMMGVANYGARSDRMNITNIDFYNMKIKLPLKNEQNEISNILNKSFEEVELLETKLDGLKEQKKGLMQLLLTGIVRVKV